LGTAGSLAGGAEALRDDGQRVMRYTWRRVWRSPDAVAAELAEALAWRLVPTGPQPISMSSIR
jgi:hypothetical protein